jgi:hypothetical protein
MTAQPESQEKVEHRAWRRWALGSIVVLLLVLTPIAALRIYEASLAAEANHRIAELDREMPGWRQSPVNLEAAPAEPELPVAIRKAFALLPKGWSKGVDDNADSALDPTRTPAPCLLPKDDADELAIVIKRAAPALGIASTLADLPVGRAIMKPEDFQGSTEIQNVRTVGSLLEYAIFDRVQRGDVAGAWKLCRAQRNLGKPYDQGPLIHALVRIALMSIADSGLERTLAHGEVSEADLAALERTIAVEEQADYFYPYLPGECAYWLQLCDDVIADPGKIEVLIGGHIAVDESKWSWREKLNHHYPRPMNLKAKVESVEQMAMIHRLRSVRGFARYEAMADLDRKFGTRAPSETVLSWPGSSVVRIAYAERRLLARLGCAEVGLAAERHRLKFGDWPATAKELVDKGLLTRVPEDPFDGNPLRVRRFAQGFVVYAVGAKKDYAGTDWDDFDDLQGRDRVGQEFRLWNPDRRNQPALPPPPPPPRVFDPDEEELPPPIRVTLPD